MTLPAVSVPRSPASRVVRRSNGEQVKLVLAGVNRGISQVKISIPGYNAQFTFSLNSRFVRLTQDGRQVIDSTQPSTLNVSKTVYQGMAQWARAILTAER